MLKYASKFFFEKILPSVVATVTGAYIVNHYIVSKPATDAQKNMIRKLRDDWTASRGGRKAWKAFHDQFLSYGGPPIPLVRQQMIGGNAVAVF